MTTRKFSQNLLRVLAWIFVIGLSIETINSGLAVMNISDTFTFYGGFMMIIVGLAIPLYVLLQTKWPGIKK